MHLFDLPGQQLGAERIVVLLKPAKGAMALGRQVGNVVVGEMSRKTAEGKGMYRHNEESFRKMWEEVGKKTGRKWKVETALDMGDEGESAKWDPNFRDLKFAISKE